MTSAPKAATTSTSEASKNALKRARAEGKKEAEATLRKQMALPPPGNWEASLSARAKKRAKQQAKKPQMLLNGGVNDGTAKGTSKGKSKGSGKNDETFEGKPICYNWNHGVPYKAGDPCPYAHVCLICKKPDHPKIRHQ